MIQNWPLPKDPQDICKLRFDWSARLEDGETITTSTFTETGSITIDQQAIDGAYTTFRCSGGTHGEVVEITNHIVTSEGNEWDQTGKLRIRNR